MCGGPKHCDSERLAFYGRRPTTRLAGAGFTWVVNFFLYIFSLKYFFQCQRVHYFGNSSVHCIGQGYVLHVHAFRTTHVLQYIFVHCMGSIFLYCFSSYVSFFLVYECALVWCLYAHCIRHSPVLQVYTFCTACILLRAKVVTGYANVADCMTYI